MAKQSLEKIIEALLFASDKPLSASVLAATAETTSKKVENAVEKINDRMRETGSPIKIQQVADMFADRAHIRRAVTVGVQTIIKFFNQINNLLQVTVVFANQGFTVNHTNSCAYFMPLSFFILS